jgi:uncharacterized membrane protein
MLRSTGPACRTVLAGPYGHPFHPILVTIPIGAWVASVVVVALFAVNWVIRARSDHDAVSIVGMVLSIIARVALAVSGWLGGRLAYRFGVRVADEGTHAEDFADTESPSAGGIPGFGDSAGRSGFCPVQEQKQKQEQELSR